MSYTYAYNTRDIKFILKEWLPLEEVMSFDRYKEDYSVDDVDMIVDQVLKVAKDILAPIADEGETIGATWENGQAHIPPSWGKAIRLSMTRAGAPATIISRKREFPRRSMVCWMR